MTINPPFKPTIEKNLDFKEEMASNNFPFAHYIEVKFNYLFYYRMNIMQKKK